MENHETHPAAFVRSNQPPAIALRQDGVSYTGILITAYAAFWRGIKIDPALYDLSLIVRGRTSDDVKYWHDHCTELGFKSVRVKVDWKQTQGSLP